ncbi:F-box/kelch-repeat protein At3g18720-like [Tasmannia lanceolata]|uniref:F-box/kelch-repeat protein At3g18720-like n=1 Tax=Tasmannia lanceolata TaxID=3420 RepID=UPI0040639EF5
MEDTIQNNKKVKDWSELPKELLQMILPSLSFLDYLRFRAVCSRWRSSLPKCPPSQNRGTNPMPWLLLFYETLFSNKETKHAFFNPSTGELYQAKFPKLISSAKCLSSRHGWLLLLARANSSLFFYNPFTGAKIDLPYLEGYMDAASFINPPTSPNCRITAICDCGERFNPNVIVINVCRFGEKTWTSYTFHGTNFGMVKDVIFCGEIFYCMDSFGRLGAFNVENGTWNIICSSKCQTICDSYLVEYGGELFAGVGARYGIFRCLYKFVQANWVEVKALQNEVWLFLGPNGSNVTLNSWNGMDKRIYVGGFQPNCMCCSYGYGNEEREVVLACPEFELFCTPIWVEPKWVGPSPNLKWGH